MKLNKFFTIIPLATLLFGACNESIDTPEATGDTGITIMLESGVRSRTTDPGTTDERNITKLEFYVFDADGINDVITSYYTISSFQNKTKLNIGSSGDVTFVVVANSSIGIVADYDALMTKLGTAAFTTTNTRTVPTGGFEMSGYTVTAITAGTDNNNVTVKLDRLVSKFNMPAFETAEADFLQLPDFDLEELWGMGTDITNDDMTFTFEGYALINGVNKSLLLNMYDKWEDDTATPATTWSEKWVEWFNTNETAEGLSYLASSFDASNNYVTNFSGQQAGSWFLNAAATAESVYVYENAPEIITLDAGRGYDAAKVYAYIIKGTFTESATGDDNTVTRYWRINLINESDFHIYRNKSYNLTVNAIKSCGYATPEEAEKNDPIVPIDGETYVDITVVINPWGVIESGTEM